MLNDVELIVKYLSKKPLIGLAFAAPGYAASVMLHEQDLGISGTSNLSQLDLTQTR